jgi:hypothetical protein
MPIKQGFECSLVIAGGGCFPRLLDLCLISPAKWQQPFIAPALAICETRAVIDS